jgi:uncharacterized protein
MQFIRLARLSPFACFAVFVFNNLLTINESLAINCKLAASPVEKLICASEQLKALDSELNRVYSEVQKLNLCFDDKLPQYQKKWIAFRDNEFKDGQGLAQAIATRIRVLREMLDPKKANDGHHAEYFTKVSKNTKGVRECVRYFQLKDISNKAVMDSINREILQEMGNLAVACDSTKAEVKEKTEIRRVVSLRFQNENFLSVEFEVKCNLGKNGPDLESVDTEDDIDENEKNFLAAMVNGKTINWDLKTGKRIHYAQLFKPTVKIEDLVKFSDDPTRLHREDFGGNGKDAEFIFKPDGLLVTKRTGWHIELHFQGIRHLIDPKGPLGKFETN